MAQQPENISTTNAEFFCPVCYDVFSAPEDLKVHVAEWHPTTDEMEVQSEIRSAQNLYHLNDRDNVQLQVEPKYKLKIVLEEPSELEYDEQNNFQGKQHDSKPVIKEIKEIIPLKLQKFNNTNINTTNQIYQCPICDKTLKNSRNLKEHLNLHTEEMTYPCDICHLTFRSRSLRYYHYRKYHRKTKKSMKRKKRATGIHTNNQCPICFKVFRQSAYLKEHINLHTKEKTYPCDICHKTFPTRNARYLHYKNIHCPTKTVVANKAEVAKGCFNKKNQCPICGKIFKQSGYLKDHINLHTKERTFPCDICHKTFRTRIVLYKHYKEIHNTSKSFMRNKVTVVKNVLDKNNKMTECPICNKILKRPSYLKEHMNLHTEELLFSCDICPKSFPSRSRMYYHYKRAHHTTRGRLIKKALDNLSKKTFRCKFCQKSYGKIEHLNEHLIVEHHYKRKPGRPTIDEQQTQEVNKELKLFKCDICKTKFKQRIYLQKHMPIHTGEKSYSCEICHATFPTSCRKHYHKTTRHSSVKTSYKKSMKIISTGKKNNHLKKNCNDKIIANKKPENPRKGVFECNECGKKFTFKCNLKTHYKNLH